MRLKVIDVGASPTAISIFRRTGDRPKQKRWKQIMATCPHRKLWEECDCEVCLAIEPRGDDHRLSGCYHDTCPRIVEEDG